LTTLARSIGLTQATAMVVGTIVGASIFVQPSEVSRAVPSFGGMLLVWVFAGALTWFGASICAELTSAYPKTGGVYVFLRDMFSTAVGFLWGWAMFWSMHSGIIAAIAMVFGRYTATLVPMGDLGIRLTAVGGILVLSAINYFGVRPGSAVQTALTMAKVAAIAGLFALLLAAGTLRVPEARSSIEAGAFLRALVAGLFAFGGWHMVTYAAEETRDPERTIPRALIAGTAVVVVILARRRAAAPAHFLIAASQFWISTTRASSPGSGSALRVISSRPSAATSNDANDSPRAGSSTRTTDGAPMVSGFIASDTALSCPRVEPPVRVPLK
jgi:basic amino acid/polyamine antiporter, APA family